MDASAAVPLVVRYRRVWQTLAAVLFTAFALTTSVRLLTDALPRYLPHDWAAAHEYDGLIDWKGARMFLAGKSPYTKEALQELNVPGNGHPPTTSFWFIPLARFPKPLAAELVSLSTLLFLLGHVYLCVRELDYPAPVATTALVFAAALATGGMLMHFRAIQLSEQIALCYTLGWFYLRRGREWPAGIAFGVAATLKLFPGLILLFLLLAGRFRAFLASTLTFGAVALFMTRVYGFESWALFFRQQEPISRDWLGHVRNAGLQGVILRFLHPICEGPAAPDRRALALALVVSLVLVAAAAIWSRPLLAAARGDDPRLVDVPFALFCVLSVFLNAWVWEHYIVLAIQPAFVVLATLATGLRGEFRSWLEQRISHPALLQRAVVSMFGVGLVALTARLFATNIFAKEQMLALWNQTRKPFYHRALHLYELVNWLPWALMVVACLLALREARGTILTRARQSR